MPTRTRSVERRGRSWLSAWLFSGRSVVRLRFSQFPQFPLESSFDQGCLPTRDKVNVGGYARDRVKDEQYFPNYGVRGDVSETYCTEDGYRPVEGVEYRMLLHVREDQGA